VRGEDVTREMRGDMPSLPPSREREMRRYYGEMLEGVVESP